jgi:hypothetical protein
MATVDELETAAEQWLKKQRGKLLLQRNLYLVPGFEDEGAGCWLGGSNTIADFWGPRIFSNWQLAVASRDRSNEAKWKWANVRVIDFDENVPRRSFLEFGETVRAAIVTEHPHSSSSMGEYDIVGHSMGGLDSFVALVDALSAGPQLVQPPQQIARAFNYVTMDTPYRGIPNWEARTKMSGPTKRDQCRAMAPGCAELTLVDTAASQLAGRVVRVTCYGVDSASQVEVTSGDLYADENRFSHERSVTDYRFFQIPGASHSGPQGITQSLITIANLFYTITTGTRLSR